METIKCKNVNILYEYGTVLKKIEPITYTRWWFLECFKQLFIILCFIIYYLFLNYFERAKLFLLTFNEEDIYYIICLRYTFLK